MQKDKVRRQIKSPIMVAAGIKAAHTRKWRKAQVRAAYAAKWSTTMTRWLITFSTSGKAWQVVGFAGPSGGESTGIVDLVAVRRDHAQYGGGVKRGDLFDMVFIQIKGGNAPWPNIADVERLRRAASYHRAKAVVLCEWQKGRRPNVYALKRSWRKDCPAGEVWTPVENASSVFA